MRWLLKAASSLLVIAVVVVAATAYFGYREYEEPGPLRAEATLIVQSGSGVAAIARQLEDARVIEDARVFRAAARITDKASKLRAGEYRFEAGISLEETLDLLVSGETVVRKITVPEGLTSFEVVALIEKAEGLSGEIAELPAEGSLLPETLHFTYGDPRAGILERMRGDMQAALEELWAARAENLPVSTPEEAVILASIVEKETAVADERPLVASVFVNRLNRGMPLQSDPTVVYALTEGKGPLGRALTRADWKVDHPYNTYANSGLPPGPIANPGRESLSAALNPAESEYLYFVADGSGGHAFAKTLAEHNRNVAKWRRIRDAESE
ncbi:MAG: endolytic transglycosylase MltG [Rhodovibrionaceae bacterium]